MRSTACCLIWILLTQACARWKKIVDVRSSTKCTRQTTTAFCLVTARTCPAPSLHILSNQRLAIESATFETMRHARGELQRALLQIRKHRFAKVECSDVMVQEQNNEDCVAVPKASVGAGGMNCGTGSTLNAYRGPSHETSLFLFRLCRPLSSLIPAPQSPKPKGSSDPSKTKQRTRVSPQVVKKP